MATLEAYAGIAGQSSTFVAAGFITGVELPVDGGLTIKNA